MSWNSKQGTDLLGRNGWLVNRNVKVLITGARLIDPSQDLDKKADILIDRGKIVQIGTIDRKEIGAHHHLNLKGKTITPGFFDMHVHLREPGREDKETILTGTCAAAAGGFTGVAAMPNTDPAPDNVGVVRWIIEQSEGAPVAVHPVGTVSRNREGKMLADIADLFQAGVRILSDDGSPVANAEVMRRALEYTQMHDMVISTHSEEMALAGKGVMREGEISTRLGLPGWPSLAESVMVARDVLLAQFTGGRLHVGHISSVESIEMVRWAKARGVKVTCEATPHHIALTDEACESFDGNYKMNPPLGSERDRAAVIQGLVDGTIDVLATDHAPHTDEECLVEFSFVPNGIVGLETAVGVIAKELVAKKKLDWPAIVRKMAIAPREIMRLPQVPIKVGAPAELTMIDPDAAWTVDPEKFLSKGRNTPFGGWNLPAKPIGIINRGWVLVAPDARMHWS